MSAHKANLEILIGLQGKAFEGIEKLVALNVATAKSAGAKPPTRLAPSSR